MTTASPPLTPEAALGWLRSLSVDIRAAAVLDASGAVLAGDRSLAGTVPDRRVLVTRSERHAVVVRRGRRALEGLLRADMRAALDALEPG
ncbi:MAG TPA: hypothetical protein VF257_08750 [Solirubrobacteraceae bacterium]